jgi:hypothetical protein
MNDSTRINGATRPDGNGDDRAAAKRLLWNMRERLENLQCDLISLGRALDGPPGVVSVLAAELLDEDQDLAPGAVLESGRSGGLDRLDQARAE